MNIIVDFTSDDNPENYVPSQTVFRVLPKGQNSDPNRPGNSDEELTDNPEKRNVSRNDSQLIWYDNPGMAGKNTTPASVNGTFLSYFTSTVKPKDAKNGIGQPTDKVLFWAVRLDVKSGKIVKAVATEITKEYYYQKTNQKPPEEKKN